MGMGHCSAFVAALTGRRSIVAINKDFKYLGTRCGAACHKACGQCFKNPIITNCEICLSRNFLFSAGYFLTLTLTGCLVVPSHISMGGTSAGPSIPSLNWNISLCFSIESLKCCTPALGKLFLKASFNR